VCADVPCRTAYFCRRTFLRLDARRITQGRAEKETFMPVSVNPVSEPRSKTPLIDLGDISASQWLAMRQRLRERGQPSNDADVLAAFEQEALQEQQRELAELDRIGRLRKILPIAAGIWTLDFTSKHADGIELLGNDTSFLIGIENCEDLRQFAADMTKLANAAEAAGF
jgi:hypothetical protein